MAISVFELFKIGIGPSSSHTVGPMRAAATFVTRLRENELLDRITRVQAELFGSLAHTGRGHGSDKALILGLLGEQPDQVDPDHIPTLLDNVAGSGMLPLGGAHPVPFDAKRDLLFSKRRTLPLHPNGMQFRAWATGDQLVFEREYYSVGGGFVMNSDQAAKDELVKDHTQLPLPFSSGDELLAICQGENLSIADVMRTNEAVWRTPEEIDAGLLHIWAAMRACIRRGCEASGTLPGGLHVARRAPEIYDELRSQPEAALKDPLSIMDWVNLYALAVNEENAAGGRVVTAPTNGAAGILPAVLLYYVNFCPKSDDRGVIDFLLTAGAIGILYKENASISGAEVGCQGEVGVACSMAAGALTAALGGSPGQVENAAEIGMEHNLGLTCDPIGGLVQIPCIERNAMGALKAINAQRLAMRGDGKHRVSLDKVIKTMRDTGADMKSKYKETSRGGLAVNVIEC